MNGMFDLGEIEDERARKKELNKIMIYACTLVRLHPSAVYFLNIV